MTTSNGGLGFYRLFGFDMLEGNYPLAKWAWHVHPEDREKTEVSLQKQLSDIEKRKWTADYRFRKADDAYAHVVENGYILRDRNGQAVRMIGVLRDVTRQKQEEHELKLLSSVITNTNDMVLIAESNPDDIAGLKILYVNAAFTKMTGYAATDIVGKSPVVLKGFSPSKNDFGRLRNAIRNLEPVETETVRYQRNGESYDLNLSLHPVADDEGMLTHWISIGHDVTDRLRYIREIEEQNQKFQEIAWMQSHVIRAPLARLMSLIDLVKNYQNSEIEKTELLDHILTSAYSLDDIIRDISAKTEQL
jgi:PAS domain S-box-containing protein